MSERRDIAKALTYYYRHMRANVRYYLKYPPDVLERMTLTQLAEAYQDVVYIRAQRPKYEPED